MKQFYNVFSNEKVSTMTTQLSWSHYTELLPIKNIDLLLFNIKFNCYVVVELKITKLKKDHIGQIQIYMNYIDENIKKLNQNKTIGIIICKENNRFIIKYSSDNRIISREYTLV